MTDTASANRTAPAAVAGNSGTDHGFSLSIDLDHAYTQRVDFGVAGIAPLVIDEPAPLGEGQGPNPARMLGAAVGGCLGASLLFCMRKARVDVRGLKTTVEGTIGRNERGRLRVQSLRVVLAPVVPAEQHDRVPRCLELFEEFCTVTGSIASAIPVDVEVHPVAA